MWINYCESERFLTDVRYDSGVVVTDRCHCAAVTKSGSKNPIRSIVLEIIERFVVEHLIQDVYVLILMNARVDCAMEWSKDKTLKLIELLQLNASLWNPSLCDTRRDKQKRKEELRTISDILGISVPDTTKKIQHLRTQYNRESAREARANAEDPHDRYISNWYAFEYLHFMKDSNKPYRILQTVSYRDNQTNFHRYFCHGKLL